MQLAGLLALITSLAGITRAYLALPEIPKVPAPLFYVLLAAGLVSAVDGKRSGRPLLGLSAVVAALTWAAAQASGQHLVNLARRLAENPYITVAPEKIVTGGFVVVVLAGLFFELLAWRAAANLAATAPVAPRPAPLFNLPVLEALFAKPVPDPPDRSPDGLPAVNVGRDDKTRRPVTLEGAGRFMHTIVIGPTGCGKTSRILLPMVYQDLKRIARGEKLGVTVIEPKGDFVREVAALCGHLGIPYVLIDPEDPDTHKFNPLQGDAGVVAETMRTVLSNIFGPQEAFFRGVQELAARQVTLLLKALKGDDLTMLDMVRALRDPDVLNGYVTRLEQARGPDDLTQYFRRELLGHLKDKYFQFAIGLRQQLEDITGNELLRRVITGNSDIDLDRHLEQGGVLLVSTAMGPLGKLGDTFGQFVIMFLQSAVFRRPGTEWERTPHYLYIDEVPRYLNPELERLLSLGRSYRCACVLALQSLSQLVINRNPAFLNTIMTNCRNKIVFGGLYQEDARKFELEFGQKETLLRQPTYDNRVLIPPVFPEKYRDTKKDEPVFKYTDITNLSKFKFIYRVTRGNEYLPPGVASGFPPPKPKGKKKRVTPEAAPPPEKVTPIVFCPSPASSPPPAPAGAPQPPAEDDSGDFWEID